MDEQSVPLDTCTLPRSTQTRNIVIYGINKGLVYFSAPIIYVGMGQAALLDRLGYGAVYANLPASIYVWMTPLAVLAAWRWPLARQLRPVLFINYLIMAIGGLLMAGVLFANWTAAFLPMVFLHSAMLGITVNVVEAYQWEVLGRGVSEKRRGEALAIAFGLGPVMAAIGSLVAQLIISGNLGSVKVSMPPFPGTFAILFGITVPLMFIAAVLCLRYELPPEITDRPRESFERGVIDGFWDFISYRTMAITVVAYILIYSGLMVMPSITLFTEQAVGQSAESLVNYQQALRFGGKAAIGFLLAQLLIRTHPKAGVLATAFLCLMGPLWALFVPGFAFMISFAFLGAGELMGVYFPNYILSLSRPENMRRNMAFCSLIVLPVGNAPVIYGAISRASSLQVSFWTAVLICITSIAICALMLPRYPKPPALTSDDPTPEHPQPSAQAT